MSERKTDERGRQFLEAYVETMSAVLDLVRLVEAERGDLIATVKKLTAVIEAESPSGDDR